MLKPASIILACVVAAFQATATHGQSAYPQRDITFIVPWNAGGSNDVAARALDPILREHGIKIVIEAQSACAASRAQPRTATPSAWARVRPWR
jgi:tripartite-type tricarboxylate transporter receptor subunit TctC